MTNVAEFLRICSNRERSILVDGLLQPSKRSASPDGTLSNQLKESFDMHRNHKAQSATTKSAPAKPSMPSGQKTDTKKSVSKRSNAGTGNGQAIDPETRYELIAREAYFNAERRGFASGGELGDWLEAERDVARMLG